MSIRTVIIYYGNADVHANQTQVPDLCMDFTVLLVVLVEFVVQERLYILVFLW